jgi:hypothetical protein
MQRIDLPLKFELVTPDVPNDHVVFLERGLGSLVATSSDNEIVEVGHIGYEGLAGMHVLLKVPKTPNKTFMQAEGDGISVPTSVFLGMVNKYRLPMTCSCDTSIVASSSWRILRLPTPDIICRNGWRAGC